MLPRLLTPADSKGREDGFMMMGAGILVLIVIALLGSFAFVTKRDTNYKGHFAAGQRVAEIATLGHYYAQEQRYAATPPVFNLDALKIYSSEVATPYLAPPDNFRFGRIGDITYNVEMHGWNDSPINTDVSSAVKAASAYLHVKIRVLNGREPAPSERIAFLAGASNGKLDRVGFYLQNIAAGDTCDGPNPTVVRWGPEASSCLNAAHLATLGFTDLAAGDIIVPVWEAALARGTADVIYRHKQPERPDMNTMRVALDMQSQPISNVNHSRTSNLVMPDNGTATINDFTIRFDSPTPTQLTFAKQSVAVNGPSFRIYDQNGGTDVLNVAGASTFTPGSNINIEKTLQDGLPLNVNVSDINGIGLDTLSHKDGHSDFDVLPQLGVTVVAVNQIDPTAIISNVRADRRLASPQMDAPRLSNLPGQAMPVYAAELVTQNAPTIVNTTNWWMMNWAIGSINQNGTNGYLSVGRVTVRDKCTGNACPDRIRDGPPDKPL